MQENINQKNPIKIVLSFIPIILVVIFALQNSNNTIVKVFFWEINAPLVILFLLCFTIGLLFGLMAFFSSYKDAKRKNKIIEQLQQKIDSLENKSI
ncbi:MAG: LapA family protein [Bacteroidota bacterium]|nr:LapA family protein [Bacteroidota bacterium]